MARRLGRARHASHVLAAEQRLRPALMQAAASRFGDLRIDRVAEQRVAKPDPSLRNDQHAGFQCLSGTLVGLRQGELTELGRLDLTRSDRG